MNTDKRKLFDAVCAATIYHYVDVAQKAVNERRFLFKKGILENPDEHFLNFHSPATMGVGNNLYDFYENLVLEYVTKQLPSFKLYFDKYGAKYFSNEEGKEYYCGDTYGRIMIFADFDSLEDYTFEVMEKEL